MVFSPIDFSSVQLYSLFSSVHPYDGCPGRYDIVFIDAFDKSGKVPPVLVDGQGTFLQSLNKVFQGGMGEG